MLKAQHSKCHHFIYLASVISCIKLGCDLLILLILKCLYRLFSYTNGGHTLVVVKYTNCYVFT